MGSLKQFLKAHLPRGVIAGLLPAYHKWRAILANFIYNYPARNLQVIAVTGTNGKTTTASFIASMLEAAGYRVGVSTTAYYRVNGKETVNDSNMTVTDPFTVQKLMKRMKRAKVDWVVLEVTAHALSQHRIHGIPIKAAVMTNLTQDHLDYYGTMEAYAAAKLKLFNLDPEYIVLNRDDEWFDYFNQAGALHKMSYGAQADADCVIKKAIIKRDGADVELLLDRQLKVKFLMKLSGKFNVYNAAAAATLGYLLHLESDQISAGLEALQAVPGRMEAIDEGQKFSVLVDYAHTPDALQNLLETAKALTKGRVILVFGACGDRDREKRPIMGKIAAKLAGRIILTDEEPYTEGPAAIRAAIFKGIKSGGGESKTKEVGDRRAAIKEAFNIARTDDTVLITGMGHQHYMTVGTRKVPWDDRVVARELLNEKLKK